MVEVAGVAAGMQVIRDAIVLLRGLRDRGLSREHQQQVDEALDLMRDAEGRLQALQAELIETRERNHQLQRQIDDDTEWQNRRRAFNLVTTPGGARVYAEGDSDLYICPVCIERREILPLQDLHVVSGHWECPACKAKFPINPRSPNRPSFAVR